MNIKGQGHSLTLVQGHSVSTFSNFFSLEIARPIEAKFHMEPPWDRRTKVCSNGPGNMTNMAAMLIYGKNIKNLSLWNQMADDLESWYAASGSLKYYQVYSGDDSGFTFTYFTARSNLVPCAFV